MSTTPRHTQDQPEPTPVPFGWAETMKYMLIVSACMVATTVIVLGTMGYVYARWLA